MEVIEKTGDEVTTFFIDSDNSKKVERNTQNFKKDSIKNLENYKGRAETFFVDSINEQKIGGRISNNELDDLVANYKESKSDEIFSQILGQVLIRTSLENIKKVGTDIFNYAIANNISGVTNFFKNVRIPKNATVNKRRALTEIEQDRIINTPHRCQSAAMIMMFSGLRRGELIPLLWSDIDLSNKIIYVNKSVEYIDNKPIVKSGGKTSNATRIVPIPPILTSYLIDYKKKSNLLSQLVCSNTSGKMHTKSSFNKMWNSYLVDLNVKYGYEHQDVNKYDPNGLPMRIERFTPHYLRHTFATLLFLQDVNVVTAKQYLGHADIQTTVNIYTDLEHNYLFNLSDSYKEKLDTIYKISTR